MMLSTRVWVAKYSLNGDISRPDLTVTFTGSIDAPGGVLNPELPLSPLVAASCFKETPLDFSSNPSVEHSPLVDALVATLEQYNIKSTTSHNSAVISSTDTIPYVVGYKVSSVHVKFDVHSKKLLDDDESQQLPLFMADATKGWLISCYPEVLSDFAERVRSVAFMAQGEELGLQLAMKPLNPDLLADCDPNEAADLRQRDAEIIECLQSLKEELARFLNLRWPTDSPDFEYPGVQEISVFNAAGSFIWGGQRKALGELPTSQSWVDSDGKTMEVTAEYTSPSLDAVQRLAATERLKSSEYETAVGDPSDADPVDMMAEGTESSSGNVTQPVDPMDQWLAIPLTWKRSHE